MILAIYALVLQALFGALAQGEAVGARLLAAELGIICAPGDQGHEGTPGRGHDGSCCLAACQGSGATPAVLPQAVVLAGLQASELAAPVLPRTAILAQSSTRVPPARGPPTAG
jgi:hypothetical protein